MKFKHKVFFLPLMQSKANNSWTKFTTIRESFVINLEPTQVEP